MEQRLHLLQVQVKWPVQDPAAAGFAVGAPLVRSDLDANKPNHSLPTQSTVTSPVQLVDTHMPLHCGRIFPTTIQIYI